VNKAVDIRINGQVAIAQSDITVAAALVNAGIWDFRTSVGNEARGPLCGMGICYECRVTINGVAHRRACLRLIEQGMEISTHG
jgi:aerobic-type carbon monoxide dehydrogenase small subunit (CoxS/CutS family)